MGTYKLEGDYPLKSGGRLRQPGEAFEMDDDVAAPLVERGRLKPVHAKKEPAGKGKE